MLAEGVKPRPVYAESPVPGVRARVVTLTLDGSLPKDRWDGLSHAQYVDRSMLRGIGWGSLAALATLLGLGACDPGLLSIAVVPVAACVAVGGVLGRVHGERNGPDQDRKSTRLNSSHSSSSYAVFCLKQKTP